MAGPTRADVAPAQMARGLAAFRGVVGDDWVLAEEQDRAAYTDPYAIGDENRYKPGATVAPASAEEVQAIVRLANQHRIPLWPVSRGKNFGYGGPAPRVAGAVVLDLGRMKRILEVDPETASCLIEPGVSFFDLYRHLTEQQIPLWMSVPGNGWGSVVGNALERGFGQFPMGDHSNAICGLEVVLPDGELMRTGMGAMSNSQTWSIFKNGFGPGWDQIFMQSNYGVVTKAGLWLVPEPETSIKMVMGLPNRDDLGWAVELLNHLRLTGTIDHAVSLACYALIAAQRSQRSEWFQGDGPLPDEAVDRIIAEYGIGWWNFTIRLQGPRETVEARREVIERAFAEKTGATFRLDRWERGEPLEKSAAGIPSTRPLQVINWHGGRGGHMDFSPVMPARADVVMGQLQTTRDLFSQHGLDYYGSFYVNGRTVTNINLLIYNRDNERMTGATVALFNALFADAKAKGFSKYRAHLDFMDDVAGALDFNDGMIGRFNRRIKQALDPNGIIAPGKSGIWPEGAA